MKNIQTIKDKYTSIIHYNYDLKDLDNVRISAVGKKGEISHMMQEIGKMAIEEKKQMGPLLNSLKNEIINQIEDSINSDSSLSSISTIDMVNGKRKDMIESYDTLSDIEYTLSTEIFEKIKSLFYNIYTNVISSWCCAWHDTNGYCWLRCR